MGSCFQSTSPTYCWTASYSRRESIMFSWAYSLHVLLPSDWQINIMLEMEVPGLLPSHASGQQSPSFLMPCIKQFGWLCQG